MKQEDREGALSNGPLLEVRELKKHFPLRRPVRNSQGRRWLKAVDGVSFSLAKGETLALVGESGSGKSTVANSIVRLVEPSGGECLYRGEDVFAMSSRRLRKHRQEVQLVFQDPYGSLDNRMTILHIVAEPWAIHGTVPRTGWITAAGDLLERVGLDGSALSRYPHQFSGGQRQRIAIARAIALSPELLVCDEPVSALDVSVQAQILNLLAEIQAESDLSYLFITHDLSVVRYLASSVLVMYLGRVMEHGTRETIFASPAHPYTKALFSAAPIPEPKSVQRHETIVLTGDLPSPADPPSGCVFRTRCWKAEDICSVVTPPLVTQPTGQLAACHFPEQ